MRTAALSDGFGLEIRHDGKPSLLAWAKEKLLPLLYEHKVLVVRDADLSLPEFVAFGRSLGTLRTFVDVSHNHPDYPEVFVVANAPVAGRMIGMDRVGLYWHTDQSFLKEPQPISVLLANEVPKRGGDTSFVDMGSVYSALPDDLKTVLSGRSGLHDGFPKYILTAQDVGLSVDELKARDRMHCPPVEHPAVIRHRISRKPIVYLNPGFTQSIVGLEPAESERVLAAVFKEVEEPRHRYTHRWSPRDMVLWDNRSTLHKAATPSQGQRRILYRLGIEDGGFFG
ncbi:MAG TPA: TauD/TfdA family dioxygenase [Elusimicrobiota bacterium]|nr:TauD/TfdA family dioxygenase [Elusimicrobiota bacterium]